MKGNDYLLAIRDFIKSIANTPHIRWADGRKYWAQLSQTSRNLARTIWVNTSERDGEAGKDDLLRKLCVYAYIHFFATR